jgi:hypothetical protein
MGTANPDGGMAREDPNTEQGLHGGGAATTMGSRPFWMGVPGTSPRTVAISRLDVRLRREGWSIREKPQAKNPPCIIISRDPSMEPAEPHAPFFQVEG